MDMPLQNDIQVNEARVNITWAGQNGDLTTPAPLDASDEQLRGWAKEAVRAGSIQGIPADPNADFSNFVVDRFPPTEARPHHLLALRPKTPFGA